MNALTGLVNKIAGLMKTCVFHYVTGLYCPGCGGTRAVICFLKGDWRMSFLYHPLILYTAAVVFLEAGSYALSKAFHRPGLYIRRYERFITLGAAVVILNWIFKNYMLAFRGVDLLPPL